MKHIIKIFTLFILLPYISFTQNPNLGTAGAQFLKIPVSAKAISMGAAFIGLSNDASSVFWNPAGIANIDENSVHFSYMKWFEMFDFNAAAYARNFNEYGVLGIGVVVFSTEEMEITTEESPNGTGRFFDAQDLALSISYARFLTDKFRTGISVKYIHQKIWNETASGIALDIGTQYKIDFQNMILAMSMMNFGPDMKFTGPDLNVKYDANQYLPNRLIPTTFETETFPLPLTFQFGIAMDIYNSPFFSVRAATDAIHPNDNKERIHVGAEFEILGKLFLRGGYKFTHDDERINLGTGLYNQFGNFLLKLDYAYSVYEILPDVHFISVGFDF